MNFRGEFEELYVAQTDGGCIATGGASCRTKIEIDVVFLFALCIGHQARRRENIGGAEEKAAFRMQK